MKQGFLGTQRRSSSRARVRVSPNAADDDEPPPLVCDSDDADGDFDDAATIARTTEPTIRRRPSWTTTTKRPLHRAPTDR
jgi:hypothetical protein